MLETNVEDMMHWERWLFCIDTYLKGEGAKT